MLQSVFAQHPDQPTFLILTDSNVFFDDAGGRKLATEHAHRFNLRIFRFSNPYYAEGDHANATLIEDGDGEEDTAVNVKEAVASQKKQASKQPKEGEVTSEVATQVADERKKEEATKAATKVTGGSTKSGTSGVKARKQ